MALFKKKQEENPDLNFRAKRRAILGDNSDFSVKEAYKTLRTNIRFSLTGSGCKKMCITSALPSEGKSITALNVSISFAEAGQRVLLIDADLRRPTQARLLIENGDPGLSNILAGMCTEEEAIHKGRYPNLDVIFSGVIPPNPSELLSSPRMEKLLESLSKRYDYIFIDTPPVNVVTDACVISALLDGVLFVARQNRSERETVNKAVNQLKIAGAKILGTEAKRIRLLIVTATTGMNTGVTTKIRYRPLRRTKQLQKRQRRSLPPRNEAAVKRNADFLLRQVAGSQVLVPVGAATRRFPGMIRINDTGRFLWELLETDQTRESLAEALLNRFEVSQEQAAKDVAAFVDKLIPTGAVEE